MSEFGRGADEVRARGVTRCVHFLRASVYCSYPQVIALSVSNRVESRTDELRSLKFRIMYLYLAGHMES